MPLADERVNEIASALLQAEQRRLPIEPLTQTDPDMDIEDAYKVQLAGVALRQNDSNAIVGWKVGLTSRAMQQMLGVDQPDFGHLLGGMRVDEGGGIDWKHMIWPRVEPEVAFELKADLWGPGVSSGDVLEATEYLIPALEVIDSRIRDWKIKLVDTIADNASCGRFVLGRTRTRPAGFDVKLIGMNFFVDDELTSTATAAAVIGNPAEAVAWLANTLAPFGHGLKAGQIIMPGSLVAAVDAKPETRVRADFDHIGSVELAVM